MIEAVELSALDAGLDGKDLCSFWEWLGNRRFRKERDECDGSISRDLALQIIENAKPLVEEFRQRQSSDRS